MRHDCSPGVSPPSPCTGHTHLRSDPQLHVHAHACMDKPAQIHAHACEDKPAQIHAHAHKQLDVYLRCDLSQFAEDLAVLVRKKISFEKKKNKEKNRNTRSKPDIDQIFIHFLHQCFVYFLITSSFFATRKFSSKNPLH